MIHPYFTSERARQRRADLLMAAERGRLVRRARPDRAVGGRAVAGRLRAVSRAVANASRLRPRRAGVAASANPPVTCSYRGVGATLPANREKSAPVSLDASTDSVGSGS